MTRHKLFQFPQTKQIVPIVGYEAFAIQKLLRDGILERDLIQGFETMPKINYYFNQKQRLYHPDIFIPSQRRIVEVKSQFTFEIEYDKNLAKMKATEAAGFQTELQIYNSRGTLIKLLNKF